MLLEVLNFATSVHVYKSKHFGLIFAYHMLETFRILCLMYIQTLLSTPERRSKPISFQKHIHPNFYFSQSLSAELSLAICEVNDYSFLHFLYDMPRVCLKMEIKRYKNMY